MGIHWNYEIKMRSCFIVEYLNVKVTRSFGDVDSIELVLVVWLVPHPFPASLFTTFVKHVYKLGKVMQQPVVQPECQMSRPSSFLHNATQVYHCRAL